MLDKLLKITLILTMIFVVGCSEDDGGGIVDPVDDTAPSAITTLATSNSTGNSITINWISTGDDENIGKARQYDIRFSESMITDVNFNSALTPDSTPYPKVSGYDEIFIVEGLMPETKYYFAIKAADEAGNWSDISNIDSATTLISGTWQMIESASLPSNMINDILVNGSDVYYATDFGLAHYDGTEWNVYQSDTTDQTSIIDDVISNMAINSNGDLWLATSGGLSKFNGTDFINYTTENSSLTTNVIKTVAVDGNDRVWIGTGSKGLFLLDGDTWTNYNTSNSNLPQNSIASLEVDSNDNLWIGFNFGGAAFFEGANFTGYSSANGFTSNGVWGITFDNDDNVWVGTDNGAAVFNGSNWTFYTSSNSPLIDDVVISIAAVQNSLGNSTIYMGTRYGLSSFTTVTWRTITTSNSELPNNFINSLTTGPTETLYIGTQNGATIYVE